MQRNGAQIVVETLVSLGVDTVFGYPGGSVLNLYDELYKNSDRINHVLTAHEQGAAHAADGYARASGRPGVVIATSGPGATNLVTGIANAYLDSVPLVAITGNVSTGLLGRDSFQEVDIAGITQPIVKHNYIVRDVRRLEATIREAFRIADSGRKGPVLIDVPKNVQAELCDYVGPTAKDGPPPAHPVPDLTEALAAITCSERPFIYCGGGVISAGAEAEVRSLSERLSAPIGLSMMGLTAVPSSYALNLGMCGMHGRYAATVAQAEADLVIAVGVRFSDRATGDTSAYTENCTILHIDIDASEHGKNVESRIAVCADVKTALAALLTQLKLRRNEAWVSRIMELRAAELHDEKGAFTPENIIRAVHAASEIDTIIATDVGQHQMWTMQHYPFERPRTLLTSGGLGTMGFGLGAAIGGCMAAGRRRTILFTSDGSFGMNLNEMATAVSQSLPITIVLLNNGVLGMVRQWQTMFYEKRHAQTTLCRKTDFPLLAKAFGAEGYTATTLEELTDILRNKRKPDGPCLIDCRIGPDECVFPMIPPGGTVQDIITE